MSKITKFLYSIFMLNDAGSFVINFDSDEIVVISDSGGRAAIKRHYPFDTTIDNFIVPDLTFYA